ncbi:competence type IV pilus minor pilin ComGD [Marinilactibacillus kalidii]|uniref:competence type IV pilus minor pilin ComGD n=1 Tax=Marinilactibacillus kalidii TaxID=2820274 RepID=UPI001ABE1862|nr:competence type IV pilus minor pilin ComGD [Marinilactibacillus kalidii]
MMNNLKDQEGFTLIESLIVLSVIAILLTLPVIPFRKVQKEIEMALFFEELQSSITLLQHHAILARESTVVETQPSARNITFIVEGRKDSKLNRSLYLPEHIELVGGSKRYRFNSASGNLGNIYPIVFRIDNELVNLKFSMGSGRFEME